MPLSENTKELLKKTLLAGGTGAGVGTLLEYLLSGKVRGIGAGAGAVGGVGTLAAVDKKYLQAIKNLIQTKKTEPKEPEDDTEEQVTTTPDEPEEETVTEVPKVKASKIKTPKPTQEQIIQFYEKLHAESKSDKDVEKVLGQYGIKDKNTLNKAIEAAKIQIGGKNIQMGDAYKDVMERARKGGFFKARDVSDAVKQYAYAYKQKNGKLPTQDQLKHFIGMTRTAGMKQEHWADYMKGRGPYGSMENTNYMATAFPQLVAGSWAPKIMSKIPATKAGVKYIPGVSLALDTLELGLDPQTGEISLDIPENIRKYDEMMAKREKYDTMQFTDTPRSEANLGKFLEVAEDGPLGILHDINHYNIGSGMLRGYVNPVTNIAVALNRAKGLAKEYTPDWLTTSPADIVYKYLKDK